MSKQYTYNPITKELEEVSEWIEVLGDKSNLPKSDQLFYRVKHKNDQLNTSVCYYNQKHKVWMYKGSDWMWVDLPVTHYKLIGTPILTNSEGFKEGKVYREGVDFVTGWEVSYGTGSWHFHREQPKMAFDDIRQAAVLIEKPEAELTEEKEEAVIGETLSHAITKATTSPLSKAALEFAKGESDHSLYQLLAMRAFTAGAVWNKNHSVLSKEGEGEKKEDLQKRFDRLERTFTEFLKLRTYQSKDQLHQVNLWRAKAGLDKLSNL